jgi:hypothetical protein
VSLEAVAEASSANFLRLFNRVAPAQAVH